MPLSEPVKAYVADTLTHIREEARLTKKADMSMDTAIAILIEDRFDRHLFNKDERLEARSQAGLS